MKAEDVIVVRFLIHLFCIVIASVATGIWFGSWEAAVIMFSLFFHFYVD